MIKRNMSSISERVCAKQNENTECEPFLLGPVGKDYLWGGERLIREFGKDLGVSPLAECWECSVHPAGVSLVASGPHCGKTLDRLLSEYPDIVGTHPQKTGGVGKLPILIKLIDADQSASIQVHPDDAYAAKFEQGSNGKAEMWYVLDADEGAELVYGFYQDMDKEVVRRGIADGTIEKYLRRVKVKKDDVFFIEPGCVHAIGKGILLAEIQQSSDITYRMYDYNRRDKNGQMRELHVEKALDVVNLKAAKEPRQPMRVLQYSPGCATELLCRCKYFQVERLLVNTFAADYGMRLNAQEETFLVLVCVDGSGYMQSVKGTDKIKIRKGDCIFVPAGKGCYQICGKMQFLKVRC